MTFPQVTPEQNGELTALFSDAEIEGVVCSCDGNESPGLDGFNFSFVKAFWLVLKWEAVVFFREFHANARLLKGFTSYFLTLVPKVHCPLSLGILGRSHYWDAYISLLLRFWLLDWQR